MLHDFTYLESSSPRPTCPHMVGCSLSLYLVVAPPANSPIPATRVRVGQPGHSRTLATIPGPMAAAFTSLPAGMVRLHVSKRSLLASNNSPGEGPNQSLHLDLHGQNTLVLSLTFNARSARPHSNREHSAHKPGLAFTTQLRAGSCSR